MIDLPDRLALFPLSGALLLPRATLPLNVFEPRYLALVRDAMADERLIGMVQPRDSAEPPALYEVGGVGRITQFAETGDGRFVIALSGLSRFRIVRELAVDTPYRQAEVSYADFAGDRMDAEPLAPAERASLEAQLKSYLDEQGLSADWEAIASADDESLVNTVASVCPFEAAEKQALLEAADVRVRAETLSMLMTFAAPESGHITLQ